MSTMIETVARAIARNVPIDGSRWNPGHGENFPVEFTDAEQKLIRSIARIAIEAMREPSDVMMVEFSKAISQWLQEDAEEDEFASDKRVWSSMVDAALSGDA